MNARYFAVGLVVVFASACSSGSPGSARADGSVGGGGSGGSTGGGWSSAGNGGDSSAAPRRICDGSDDIRLAWVIPGNPGREPSFTATLFELGFSFLYVDGHCHYWVSEPSNDDNFASWRPFREGKLGEAQEAVLHDSVSYDDFAHHAPACVGPLALDGDPTEVWDGLRVSVCNGGVQVPNDWPGRAELYAGGKDMSGPMRFEVGKDYVPDNPKVDNLKIYPWPLAKPPSYYEIDESVSTSFGHSVLITDPEDAAALRALRAQAVADAEATKAFWSGKIFVEPKGYVMSIRDDVPFANATTGTWSPP